MILKHEFDISSKKKEKFWHQNSQVIQVRNLNIPKIFSYLDLFIRTNNNSYKKGQEFIRKYGLNSIFSK